MATSGISYTRWSNGKQRSSAGSSSSAKSPGSAKRPEDVYDFSDGDDDNDTERSSLNLCLWSAKKASRLSKTTSPKGSLFGTPKACRTRTPRSVKSNRIFAKKDLDLVKFEVVASPPDKNKKKQSKESPRKRPSSTPATPASDRSKRPRKSNTVRENGRSSEKEKTTRSPKKVKAKEEEKLEEIKLKSSLHAVEPVESEETRTSEDAASASESESNENKALNDRVCETCGEEALEDYIQCSGECLQYYHKNCLPPNFNTESSQCEKCLTNKHDCFVCRSHSADVKKCSDSKCGKFYHIKCLENSYPHRITKEENNENFICPLHLCLTCYVERQDDRVDSYMKRRLLKCFKCPTAYHFTDACLSAGSVSISYSYIVCPEHIPTRASSKHVNVNWCFSCNTGGSLICCERCPAAFHQNCLETPLPEGSFFCGDCSVRKQLHYNDIVWVKLGSYRWWPGRVCHPKNVPDNVMSLVHSIGEFPIYFFGSHNYSWIHRGKAFNFVEGDLTKAPALAKGAKRDFRDAISEAVEAFTSWQEIKRNANNLKLKPPPYVYLRVNKRIGKAPKASPKEDDDSEPIVCACKDDAEFPCGLDEECFNRLTLIECDPSRCNTGEKCLNRRFRKRDYSKVQPFKTESRGWGLKALQDIKKGTFVIEYVGELIDEAECENRIKNMIEKHESNFYFLTIDRDTIIDAGPKGNLARFMNHSCSPNCETQKWVVSGLTRVGLFAIQDIPRGTELTFNYNLHCRGNEKTACNCGAKNCSGFLGVRPNKIQDEESNKKQNKPEKSKPKPNPKNAAKKEFESFHEDDCFKCGSGGELLMCDRRRCPKSYHLECLKLTKLPRGLWFCPWHHCDECGKNSTKHCKVCPTSFCNDHGANLLNKDDDGALICYEHGTTEQTTNPVTGTSDRTEEKPTDESAEQLADEPMDEPMDEPVEETADEPQAEFVAESVGDSDGEPADETAAYSIEGAVDEEIEEADAEDENESAAVPVDESVEASLDEPADPQTEKPVESSEPELHDKPSDEPSDETSGEPSDDLIEESVDEYVDEPSDEPKENPPPKMNGKPMDGSEETNGLIEKLSDDTKEVKLENGDVPMENGDILNQKDQLNHHEGISFTDTVNNVI